ncbi:MAG: fibronectin type III domain-containing protein [Lachnospiraceae bacterium]|nr:fibronectin type III domain-containing protein [Lachnospiraceae bacterium]
MVNIKKRLVSMILVLCMVFSMVPLTHVSAASQSDPTPIVNDGIAHGLSYLENQSVSKYGDEWTIFTILRAGGSISEEDKAAYLASAKAKLDEDKVLEPTDYARMVLTLGVMGQNPESFYGYNLIEKLYTRNLDGWSSNFISWTLLALDSGNYKIPENAANTRERLIERLLSFQMADGGFALSNDRSDVDMTGMIMQALAPYNNSEHSEVQEAFEKALGWLQEHVTDNAGFAATYSENSCSTAQILTALCAAGIDPLDPANEFTVGSDNVITNLYSYKAYSGFYWDPTQESSGNSVATQQVTYALEAYRRFAAGENSLYDLTDVNLNEEQKAAQDFTKKAEALPAADKLKLTDKTKVEEVRNAYNNLSAAARAYVTEETLTKLETAENTIAKLEAADKADKEAKAAADTFTKTVNALPAADKLKLTDKTTVESARKLYNNLSAAAKAYVTSETLNKLITAENTIAKLEAADKADKEAKAAADTFTKTVNALPAADKLKLTDKTAVEAARKSYNNLSAAAKAYVAKETLTKLTTAENTIANLAKAKASFESSMPSVTVKAVAYNQVKVSWKAYTNATSYIVYRSTDAKNWTSLKEVTGLSYTDQTAATGTRYYYTVKAVSTKWGGKTYSKYVKNVTATTSLGTASIKSAASAGYNSVKITWNKVSGASGYEVRCATSKNGSYKLVKTVTKGSTVSYTNSKLTAGKTYYYKVRAYRTVNGKKVYGKYSSVKSAKPVPAKAVISSVKNSKSRQAAVTWKKVSGASGYVVYRATSKNGTYKAVATIKSGSTVKYTNTKLTKGKTYYYKVRAYRTVSGKKVYGSYSSVKSVKITK